MKEQCQYLFSLDLYESNISSNARISIVVRSIEVQFPFKEGLYIFSSFHKNATGEILCFFDRAA
jgi:hypothetical protein